MSNTSSVITHRAFEWGGVLTLLAWMGFLLHGHRYRNEAQTVKQRKANTVSTKDISMRGTHRIIVVLCRKTNTLCILIHLFFFTKKETTWVEGGVLL